MVIDHGSDTHTYSILVPMEIIIPTAAVTFCSLYVFQATTTKDFSQYRGQLT